MFLSVLCSSYEEEQLENGETRVVLHLPAPLAPVKCAVLPLVRKDGLPEKAREIVDELKFDFATHYEEKTPSASATAARTPSALLSASLWTTRRSRTTP